MALAGPTRPTRVTVEIAYDIQATTPVGSSQTGRRDRGVTGSGAGDSAGTTRSSRAVQPSVSNSIKDAGHCCGEAGRGLAGPSRGLNNDTGQEKNEALEKESINLSERAHTSLQVAVRLLRSSHGD